MILLHPWAKAKHVQDNIPKDVRECYHVVDGLVSGEFDYYEFLKSHWRKGEDITIVEHDMKFKLGHIRELDHCDKVVCAFAYYLYPKSTALMDPVIAHRETYFMNHFSEWIKPGVGWADLFGFGLTKIGVDAQRLVSLPDRKLPYYTIDDYVSRRFNGVVRCHVHWPIVEHLKR